MENWLVAGVEHFGFIAILAALGIGVLTSLAPCSILTLPLMVGAVLNLSEDLSPVQKRRFTFMFSLLFVTGLVISFSLLMLAVAKVGLLLSVAPFWAYALASAASFAVVAYAAGWLGSFDKEGIARRLIRFRLAGALLIGMIFGLVSTPCASAPLAAIIAVAEQSGWAYSYALVLAFALGHAALLLLTGVSLGFTTRISASSRVAALSNIINRFFMLLLVAIGVYFAYEAYLVY